MRRHRAIGGKKSAGTEKGPYVTYNPLGLRQNHLKLLKKVGDPEARGERYVLSGSG
jgi:hypothetical protein